MTDVERRIGQRERRQAHHWFNIVRLVVGTLLACGCLVAVYLGYMNLNGRQGRDEFANRQSVIQQCRRTSRRNAANVNQNWLYYESEVLLARPRPLSPSQVRVLAQLPTLDQEFFGLLLSGERFQAHILDARANADYDAAFVNAQTVDYRDAHLIHRKTALGSGEKPYRWVLAAHFSCSKALSS